MTPVKTGKSVKSMTPVKTGKSVKFVKFLKHVISVDRESSQSVLSGLIGES